VPTPSVERKLAAIFAADLAGYSRLVGQDEAGTLAGLKACRAVIDQLIADHRGRIFNTAGDSVVADFASAVDAVQCAVATQRALANRNVGSAATEPMRFRIGIHVGDVVVDGANLLGDGVNIAARLEGLAEPGGICISGVVRDQIGNKLPLGFDGWAINRSRTSRKRSGFTGCRPERQRLNPLPLCHCRTSPRSRSCRFRT
jgi:adenylate cyclase